MCSQNKKPYYITTAIAYTSGKPHIGNTYEVVLADSIARYKRFEGYEVFFQTGTDEHGQKNEEKAAEAGVTPKQFVDRIAGQIKDIWDLVNASYDKFIRTTDEDHEKQIQKIFKKLYEKGDIYKSHYEGMYCTPCESFFTPSQLVDGRCPDCKRECSPAKEEAYFLKLSKYADRLIEHINANPEFIQPESRKNEMMNNFLIPGLQDLCVSRTSFKWGIPVDFDDKHVVYVWIDALCNYITGIGFDCDGEGSESFKKFWPADLHLIGKDILRFHTIYWPIILMALELPLPKQIFGHPWLLTKESGQKTDDVVKMSKSRGNVLYADDLAEVFGVDAVRFFVLHEMPFDNDGAISWELVTERVNSELANTLGNLVNRTVSMSNKYFNGIVNNAGADEEVDNDLKNTALNAVTGVSEKMEMLRIADAISEIFVLFKRCNKYIDETMPWILARDEEKKGRLETVLYNLIEGIVIGASLLEPFMPDSSKKILEQLNTGRREFGDLKEFGLYKSGTKVTEAPEKLFARLELAEVLKLAEAKREAESPSSDSVGTGESVNETGRSKAGMVGSDLHEGRMDDVRMAEGCEASAEIDVPMKEEISYDDFAKLQFQIGEVVACEEVKKSKKLLCLKVKIGSSVKQIVSGIKAYYSAEEMVGKKVMVLVNLKPAVLAGLVSEGMILSAEDAEGRLSLVTPERPMPSGAGVS